MREMYKTLKCFECLDERETFTCHHQTLTKCLSVNTFVRENDIRSWRHCLHLERINEILIWSLRGIQIISRIRLRWEVPNSIRRNFTGLRFHFSSGCKDCRRDSSHYIFQNGLAPLLLQFPCSSSGWNHNVDWNGGKLKELRSPSPLDD